MININFIIAIAIVFAANQFQNIKADLSIVSYDVECPKVNPEHFKDLEVYIEDEGQDNEFFINFTIIKSLPPDSTVTFKMIGASMGEFVVATGIDFTFGLCESTKEPIFGQRIYSQLKINIEECPPLPGVYGANHINLVDLDTLPDNFAPNDYKIIVIGQVENCILYECWAFFKIQ